MQRDTFKFLNMTCNPFSPGNALRLGCSNFVIRVYSSAADNALTVTRAEWVKNVKKGRQ